MKKLSTESNETTESKIFTAFIASIIRSVLVDKTRSLRNRTGDRKNYTVKACLDEMNKIEGYRSSESLTYSMEYQMTRKQKVIAKEFGLDFDFIRKAISEYKSSRG